MMTKEGKEEEEALVMLPEDRNSVLFMSACRSCYILCKYLKWYLSREDIK